MVGDLVVLKDVMKDVRMDVMKAGHSDYWMVAWKVVQLDELWVGL